MKTCTYCGAEVADDSKFCTYCGSAFAEPAAQPEPVEVQPVVSQQPEPVAPPAAAQQGQPYQPPVYGNAADQQPQPYQQPQYQQAQFQQPAGQAPTFAAPAQPAVNDSGSIGWGVLGFFFPIVGLILFLVWKNTKPNSAKVAGIGAIVGFVLNLAFVFMGGN